MHSPSVPGEQGWSRPYFEDGGGVGRGGGVGFFWAFSDLFAKETNPMLVKSHFENTIGNPFLNAPFWR